MPKFLVEREIPGTDQWRGEPRQKASQKSVAVLRELGREIQRGESYVADDKLYCVYIALSAELIRAHAACGSFPANRIAEIRASSDPTAAEG